LKFCPEKSGTSRAHLTPPIYSESQEDSTMEKLEMNILDILTDDARTPISQIAVMLGKSDDEIASTIARLERQRVILKYPALINWEKVNVDEVEAMIEVRVTPQRGEGFEAIAEQIYRFDEVSSVYLMSGGFDIAVMIEGKTLKEVAFFVAEKLSTMEGITGTATHFVLRKYKDKNTVYNRKPVDERGICAL
jgi:DNA-binding Lrp family transcriptional regulator